MKKKFNLKEYRRKYGKKFHKEYYQRNKEVLDAYRKKWAKTHPLNEKRMRSRKKEKEHYGGNRELILKRQGSLCLNCGLSERESILLYRVRLNIHHIDHKGRNVKYSKRNHNPDNMIAICPGCHGLLHQIPSLEREIKQKASKILYSPKREEVAS